MRGKRIAKIVIALAIVGIAYAAFKDDIAKLWQDLHVKLVEHPTPKKTVWLDQGISKEKLSWFYHADQGTRTFGFPYEWFMALEQPRFLARSPMSASSTTPPISTATASSPTPSCPAKFAPDRLRAGRADAGPYGCAWLNPRNKQDMTGVGLTCAGCHTGSLTYKDTALVIDGGPALTDLFKLKQGMGVALVLTRYLPGRFSRFAERILGPDASVDDRETLKNQLDQVLDQYKQVNNLEERVASQASWKVTAGSTRSTGSATRCFQST